MRMWFEDEPWQMTYGSQSRLIRAVSRQNSIQTLGTIDSCTRNQPWNGFSAAKGIRTKLRGRVAWVAKNLADILLPPFKFTYIERCSKNQFRLPDRNDDEDLRALASMQPCDRHRDSYLPDACRAFPSPARDAFCLHGNNERIR